MSEESLKIIVDGNEFDTDDLTYEEMRTVRRLIRNEIWDERLDGPFDWNAVSENEVMPATITVLMRRIDPAFTVQQALGQKPLDVVGEGIDEDGKVPPTLSLPASDPTEESAGSGSQT